MKNITSLKNHCGIGVTLLIDDKEEKFRLGVFASKDWNGKEVLEYGMVNEDQTKFIFGSLYSGGTTGFGLSDYEDMTLPEGKQLITTDMEVIKQMAYDADVRTEEKRDSWLESQKAKSVEINRLPKEEKLLSWDSMDFYFTRGEASFNSTYSRDIQCRTGLIMQRKGTESRKNLYFEDYFTKAGSKKIKRFLQDISYFVGEDKMQTKSMKEINALLDVLKAAIRDAKKRITDIAGNHQIKE
jgi:hypothetical protein